MNHPMASRGRTYKGNAHECLCHCGAIIRATSTTINLDEAVSRHIATNHGTPYHQRLVNALKGKEVQEAASQVRCLTQSGKVMCGATNSNTVDHFTFAINSHGYTNICQDCRSILWQQR